MKDKMQSLSRNLDQPGLTKCALGTTVSIHMFYSIYIE